jgi:hypothetical protein
MHDRYHGNDQVGAANGARVHINHIGNSVIPTTHRTLHLNIFSMFHVLKNILSQFIDLTLIIISLLSFIHIFPLQGPPFIFKLLGFMI